MSDKYILQTPSIFQVDDAFDDPRFMRVRIAVMHSGENLNKSVFQTETIKKAKETFKNVPILANVIVLTDEEGNEYLDYGSHDMHKEEDVFNEGERRTIYDEKVVGIIPEQNDFEIVHDDENDVDYAVVTGMIFRLYGNYVADILEARGGKTSVSCEVNFDKTSFDAKSKLIIVDEFTMLGVTLLGEDVQPAMKNANATVFSLEQNSRQEQMINVMKELTEALNKYTATFADKSKRKEEKDKLNTELFNELCEKYSAGESGDSSNDGSDNGADDGSGAEDSGASSEDDNEGSDDQSNDTDDSDVSTPVSALGASNDGVTDEGEEDEDELEANNSYPSGTKLYQVEYLH